MLTSRRFTASLMLTMSSQELASIQESPLRAQIWRRQNVQKPCLLMGGREQNCI